MTTRRDDRASDRSATSAEVAARTRLEAWFARVDRLIPDDLAHLGLAPGRAAERAAARRVATEAVTRADLGWLAAEAQAAARDRLIERWAGGLFRPTWAGALNWGVSTGRADDRAAVIRALEDAALACVAEGLVDDEVVAALAADGDAILGQATGGPAEESLAAAVHAAAAARGPIPATALVLVLVLLAVPAAMLVGLGDDHAAVAVQLGVGALVLVAALAVIVVRRARRLEADAAETP